ncbi:hypothetical protein BCR35DRAFT_353249 [Leucosporidium creatinivorum]|uniref:histidine kinase n=1 Tax=Leucosporidium creatinivorum TaxID=106004 RepID=A0A1Y2EZ37_9BASI|nr:hypothetical protein BCR35DRAFT_353249 [Leucosporidium creatinivorum]
MSTIEPDGSATGDPLANSADVRSSATASGSQVIHLVSTTPSPSVSSSGSPPSRDSFSSPSRDDFGSPRSTGSLDGGSEWEGWLRNYSSGAWRGDAAPHPPPAISAVLEAADGPPVLDPPPLEKSDSADNLPSSFSLYPESVSSRDSRADDDDLLDHFKKHGYLKGPKGKFEQERLRTVRRYNLEDPGRRRSVDRICRLAKQHFQTSTIIITLVFEGRSVVAAEAGFDSSGIDPSLDSPVRPLPDLDISLCAHGILKVPKEGEPKEAFVVPDLSKDWRFKNNPQSLAQGGSLAFYAASTINLPTISDSSGTPSTLPVGSICVLSDKPRASGSDFTAQDRQFLHDCSDMVAREFYLGYEATSRELEKAQSTFLGAFVETVLVSKLDSKAKEDVKKPASPVAPSTSAVQDEHATHDELHAAQVKASVLGSSFELAAQQLLELTSAKSAGVLDLRAFRAPVPNAETATKLKGFDAAGMRSMDGNSPRLSTSRKPSLAHETIAEEEEGFDSSSQPDEREHNYAAASEAQDDVSLPQAKDASRIYLMGSAGDVDWTAVTREDGVLARAVTDALLNYYDHGRTEYGQSSPLVNVLPPSVSSTCIVPVFDEGVPSLLIVLTSSDDKFHQFETSERKFVQNVGSILASGMLRERAFAVDRAKLAFVSQISHELRTPLHGVTSQLELIREFSSPQQLLKLAPMLDAADCSLETLRDVLDDVLDYSKFSNTTPEQESTHRPTLTISDLSKIGEDVAKATWVRKRRTDLVNVEPTSYTGKATTPGAGKVDMILEVEERLNGWNFWTDPGGLKRVLLNLIGNSLKFTENGFVKLSIREGKQVPSSRLTTVIIDVEDSGKGMDPEFIRSKLFTPFVQADPFSGGAGLGCSITAQIVKRMKGSIDVVSTVGRGTIFRLTLPLESAPPDSIPPSPGPDHPQFGFPTPRQLTSPTTPRQSMMTSTSPRMVTRNISNELMALFNPGTRLATPSTERPDFDFVQAVDAAQSALGLDKPKLWRIPSGKRRKPILNDRASPSDIAAELATLAFSEAASSPPPPAPPAFDLKPLPTAPFGNRRKPSSPLPPQVPPTLAPPPSPPLVAPLAPTLSPKPRINVLFADDNPIARNILDRLFKGKNIQSTSANDGQEAVDAYKAAHKAGTPFHLFCVDLQMPLKDGLQASGEIREYEREVGLPRFCRIIALTGLNNEADMQKAGVLSDDGPVDLWVTKGGKSLRTVLQVVADVQAELDAVHQERL